MNPTTVEELKRLDRSAWHALLESLKARHPIEQVVMQTGPEFRLARSGHELRGVTHDSLVVTPSKGLYQWHSRREAGDIFNWLMHRHHVDMLEAVARLASGTVGGASTSPSWANRPAPEETPPLPQDLHLRYHRRLDEAARAWWHSQGISDQGIARFLLGVSDDHGDYGRAYTIPIIEAGRLVNLRLRLAEPRTRGDKYRPWDRGRGTQLFNADILTPELGAVVITAGEKKAMVLWEYGISAVSPTGGCGNWRESWTTRLQFCRKVYLCFDPTEQAAAWKLAAEIGERAFVARLPDKPDDFILTAGRDAFRRALAQADPYADREYWRKQLGGRNLWGRTI